MHTIYSLLLYRMLVDNVQTIREMGEKVLVLYRR